MDDMENSKYLELQKRAKETVFNSQFENKLTIHERITGEELDYKYNGFSTVAYSFMSLFSESLNHASSLNHKDSIPTEYKCYGNLLILINAHFIDIRASYTLYRNGYVANGYGFLRDVLDRTYLLICYANNILDLYDIDGLEKNSDESTAKSIHDFTKKAKDNKSKAFKELFGAPLAKDTQSFFRKIKATLHNQVHQSLSSKAELLESLKQNGQYSIYPSPNEASIALFMNRFSEISWFTLRLLPFLQISPNQFGQKYNNKWKLLDQCFYELSGKTISFSGGDVGRHISDFVDVRLNFTPETSSYIEVSDETK